MVDPKERLKQLEQDIQKGQKELGDKLEDFSSEETLIARRNLMFICTVGLFLKIFDLNISFISFQGKPLAINQEPLMGFIGILICYLHIVFIVSRRADEEKKIVEDFLNGNFLKPLLGEYEGLKYSFDRAEASRINKAIFTRDFPLLFGTVIVLLYSVNVFKACVFIFTSFGNFFIYDFFPYIEAILLPIIDNLGPLSGR